MDIITRPQTTPAGRYYASQSAEGAKNLITGAGALHKIIAINTAGATRYLYIYDNTAASGTILYRGTSIVAAGQSDLTFALGMFCTTGLTIAPSTTQATFTLGGSDFILHVWYAPTAKLT